MSRWLTILVLVIAFCLTGHRVMAQGGITKKEAVPFPVIKRLLNSDSSLTSLRSLQGRITLVDFFGTWCVPCIKALPHLEELGKKYKNDLTIVLVSTETEAQLLRFIRSRKGFVFPVIVDEGNEWNNFFQPPSLPYTVAVAGSGAILSVKPAGEITEEDIRKWLSESDTAKVVVMNKDEVTMEMIPVTKTVNPVLRLSQDYIYAAKTGEPVLELSRNLEALNYNLLVRTLSNDRERKAFWINLYNGYTQIALKGDPGKYRNRNAFFKAKNLVVAGKRFSLDDIEHDILRRSKPKWSLGYFSKLFPSGREKQLRVDTVDYRIHFALNCGAQSCPPIAFYDALKLDLQLDMATKSYLSGEAEYANAENVIALPRLMSWFRGDFGGKKGMIRILKKNGIIPADAHPKIRFKEYDWTLSLNNYTN